MRRLHSYKTFSLKQPVFTVILGNCSSAIETYPEVRKDRSSPFSHTPVPEIFLINLPILLKATLKPYTQREQSPSSDLHTALLEVSPVASLNSGVVCELKSKGTLL